MVQAWQAFTVLLVAVAMALSLAHALELPGKLRLSREQYLAVQPIYYPGFTIGGAAEPLGILALIVLLLMTPGRTAVSLTYASLLTLLAAHATYWLFTHPVNNFWLKNVSLEGWSAGFFGLGSPGQASAAPEWTLLRDRWEYSHVLRAAFAFFSLVLVTAAVAV
jgi:hypothetical protein